MGLTPKERFNYDFFTSVKEAVEAYDNLGGRIADSKTVIKTQLDLVNDSDLFGTGEKAYMAAICNEKIEECDALLESLKEGV